MNWNKQELFIETSDGKQVRYNVIHKDELEIFAERKLRNFIQNRNSIQTKKDKVRKLFGLKEIELEQIWESGKSLLYELSDKQKECLKEYIKKHPNYSVFKMISWDTDGCYDEVGDYYLLPDKLTMKDSMRNMLKSR